MLIKLIALGSKMPAWVQEGCDEYQGRLRADVRVQLLEIPLQKRLDAAQLRAAREKEDQLIVQKIAGLPLVILDGGGTLHSSEGLAQRLRHWQNQHREMALLIGAPEGISPAIKARAQESWSLGALTLPHPLVRIVALEALYRAWSINQGHPYHRA